MSRSSLSLYPAEIIDADISRSSHIKQSTRRRTKQRKRFALPLVIGSDAIALEVMTCPDSGSDQNIISLELVNRLRLKIQESSHDQGRFSIANGSTVEAVGQVSAQCAFITGSPADTLALNCVFNVFNSLAVPAIMGMDFLQQTETFGKHKDRLVEELVPMMQSLRVNSVGWPKQNLTCRLGTSIGCATTDTGSDLDLVSPKFAIEGGFNVDPANEELQFADCSVGYTSGIINTSFAVGNFNSIDGFIPCGESIDLEFYVLDTLYADILIGQDTIEALNVFTMHTGSLIPRIPRHGESDVNIIRHIGTIEGIVSRGWGALKKMIPKRESRKEFDSVVTAYPALFHLEDQRENARREAARSRIETLTGQAKDEAAKDEVKAEELFEEERSKHFMYVTGLMGALAADTFAEFGCSHHICQTQHLLDW